VDEVDSAIVQASWPSWRGAPVQASDRVATSFGQLLRQHRLDAGLTQGVLAERAGVSIRALQYLEGRFGQPFPETTRRLVQALALAPEQAEQFIAAAMPAPRRRSAPVPLRPSAPRRQMDEQALPADEIRAPASLSLVPSTSGALPVQLTSFVGREADLTAARALLLRPNVRLLTLTGAPGTGKTRLAIELAATLTDQFANGVVFVSLAPLTDPALVLDTIAQALGVLEVRAASSLAAVTGHLRDRETLLLLDNFEQVLPAALQIADLLGACPRLTMLVTSQAPLAVRGEHELAISPLPVPDPTQIASTSTLADSAAVALFVDRAQAVRADFALTDANAATVAEICARLDGLPLAIELAAARIRLFSPQAMLARMERRLPLLTGGASDLPARQRTLRDTIAWSYDLLDPAEQALFRRLAVFVGGATLDAIERVCGEVSASDVLDGVATLVARSLLRQGEGSDGEPRLTLLETIREFGLEQLAASGELAAVRQRHAAYVLSLAEEADPHLRGPEQVGWLDRLETEHDNVRAALSWSEQAAAGGPSSPEVAQVGLRLVGALYGFWYLRGYAREGRAWLSRLLPDPAEVPAPSEVQTFAGARAHFAAGWLALFQGDYAAARPHDEASVAIWRALGDRQGLGRALIHLGIITRLQGDLDGAARAYEESATHLRDVGDQRWLSMVQMERGIVAQHRGDAALALRLFEESEALARAVGDRAVLGLTVRVRGVWYARQGDLERAEQLYCAALTSLHDLGERWFTPRCLLALAGLATERGQMRHAVLLLGATDALIGGIGGRLYPYEIEEQDGYLARARAALGEAAFTLAWADGQALTREDAVTLALERQPPPSAGDPSA
jgi:predicted ATPase/transcriptional regulator with XRE-family HTH domain